MLKEAQLLITEPWEFGTNNGTAPLDVQIVKQKGKQYLLRTKRELIYKGNRVHFLPLIVQDSDLEVDLNKTHKVKSLRVTLAYVDRLNELTFETFDFKNVRGSFFNGGLSF